jgi:4-alpha-glucanotransferase
MIQRKSSTSHELSILRKLAKSYGVQTSYDDVRGQRCDASPESLITILKLLGAPLERTSDCVEALHEKQLAVLKRRLDPVALAWDGHAIDVELRLPEHKVDGTFQAEIVEENGESHQWEGRLADLPAERKLSGSLMVRRRLAIPGNLPLGYHRLVVQLLGESHESLLLAAPTRAYSPSGNGWQRSWGAFAPLYALRSDTNWGAGDFSDLRILKDAVRNLGGGLVATLPLLAAFLDEPFEISPYSPVSRLFWNEFYLNIAQIPDLAYSPKARSLLESTAIQTELAELRSAPMVDYRRTMALKRQVLEEVSKAFFTKFSSRRDAYEQYASEHSYLDSYGRFRAATELSRRPWPEWSEDIKSLEYRLPDFKQVEQYHTYVQWLANAQLEAAAARDDGCGLYLDLPLGVNLNGYDVWREPTLFATGVAGGCPPDIVFTQGQNWGFAPLHPENIRTHHYRYVRDFLRHQMRFTKVLRIDHMASFHRVWWIPSGAAASEGVYVRYPAEELYAVFALESHRHKTMLVGEDLGTVPPEVPRAMARHNVHRMYVVQYELKPDSGAALPEPPATSVASVNTHDMPPFAGFWTGEDLSERAMAGLLRDDQQEEAAVDRETLRAALRGFLQAKDYLPPGSSDTAEVLAACLAYLRDNAARIVVLNLEDLYGEIASQNVPSGSRQDTNWRRKSARSLPELCTLLANMIREQEFANISR